MTTTANLIAPIVTDADRRWALEQCPPHAALGDGRTYTTTTPLGPVLDWAWFVDREAKAFARYFTHARKTPGDWSRIWRRGWWPKAEPWKFGPRPTAPAAFPYWNRGSVGFRLALGLTTPAERALFERIGVAQFRHDDPRVGEIRAALEQQRNRGSA